MSRPRRHVVEPLPRDTTSHRRRTMGPPNLLQSRAASLVETLDRSLSVGISGSEKLLSSTRSSVVPHERDS